MAELSGDVVFRVDRSDNDSDLWDDSALIKAYDKAISYVKGMTKDGSEKEERSKPKRKRGGKKKNKKNLTPTQTKWKIGDRCKSVFTEDDQVYSAVVKAINNKKTSCIVKYTGYGNEEEKRLSDLFSESEAEASVNSKAELENGYDSMEWTDHSQSPMHPSGSGAGPRKRSHHPPQPHPPHPPPPHPPHPPSMTHPLGYTSPYAGSWYPPHPAPPPPMPPPPPMMSPLPFAPWGSPAAQMMPGWGGASPHPASQTPPRIPSMPPTPPHPPLPEDVEDMDKEALHSMLMSWYMSGYHTGYYEGLKRSKTSSHSTTSKPKEDGAAPRREQGRQTRIRDRVKETKEPAPSQPAEESQDSNQET